MADKFAMYHLRKLAKAVQELQDNILVLAGYFDDGFERAHENPDTEQDCTYTIRIDMGE